MAEASATHARVAVFIDRHLLLAEINVGGRRLSDLLNDPSHQHVLLERVRVTRPDRAGEPFTEYGRMAVRKTAIHAVMILSEPPRPADRRIASYVPKTPVRVAIALPALDVAGCVHISGKLDPIVFLLEGAEPFVAVSNAQVMWPHRPGGPLEVPVTLVSRARIEAAGPAA